MSTSEATRSASEPDVLQRLVDNHAQFLAFLQRRVRSRQVAEDILQEAFIRGIDRLSSLRDDESAVAWFYRLLRNALIDHARKQASERRALEGFARETAIEAERDTGAFDEELHTEVCRCLTDLVDTLKPEYAGALRRIELEGAALAEYAHEAQITANNAAVRVHRARLALKRQLELSCGTCATHGCLDCTCDSSPAGGCSTPGV
jgi:RNA polymerase sigma-70 factor (ECF subfamily)